MINAPKVIVLLDTSLSMMSKDAFFSGTPCSRYRAACKQLEQLQEQMPGEVAVIAFSDQPHFCPEGVPTKPGGTTDLGAALAMAREADNGLMRFVVISDGDPNSKDHALAEARQFSVGIDTIAIGHERGGRTFLRRLANSTGGTYHEDAGTLALAQTIAGLLAG
jgi:hypothetical protein